MLEHRRIGQYTGEPCFDRQTFVAVPLQKAADRLLASASLKSGALLLIMVKDAFFDIHHGRRFRQNVRR
jgi:hypothetical protein